MQQATRIIAIRHGETAWNVDTRIPGHLDIALNDTGHWQARQLGRALAQEPVLLVMDEPTASLDFGNQIRVLETIAQLRQQGMAVLLSTHQPEHALRIADRIALLGNGCLVAIGASASTATPERLAALYNVSERAVAASLGVPSFSPSRHPFSSPLRMNTV